MEVVKSFPGAVAALESLSKELGLESSSLSSADASGSGGNFGDLSRLVWTDEKSGTEQLRLMVKTVPKSESKQMISRSVGLAREAMFFNSFAKEIGQHVALPKVYYSEGEMASGRKIIVMEELQDVTQSGYFFGPGSPINHGKDLKEITEKAGSPALKDVVKATFRSAAELHARYWKDESLLQHPWLRGSSWLQGDGEDLWQSSQKVAADAWHLYKEKRTAGTDIIDWPDDLLAVVDASVSKISWESFIGSGRPWTLVHGDFHPANVMWRHGQQEGSGTGGGVVLLDWELVGLGSGPQDIGQYMISHMEPAVRKECEEEVVRCYYERLVSVRGDGRMSAYTWEECWAEYVAGGVGRWMWFLAYFAGHGNKTMQQFFSKQVAAFVRDHGVTADTVGQPRC